MQLQKNKNPQKEIDTKNRKIFLGTNYPRQPILKIFPKNCMV